MPAKLYTIGRKFGRLKVIAEAPSRRRKPSGILIRRSLCLCDCGNQKEVETSALKRGNTVSCGCLKRERAPNIPIIHGCARHGQKTGAYKSWGAMMGRCSNPNHKGFKHYGGRGITVCERWRSFENFLADMGERPEGKSIDRFPNRDGNYEPGNCRWATAKEQGRNLRRNRVITAQGVTACLAEFAERNNLHWSRIAQRLLYGWAESELFSPPNKHRSRHRNLKPVAVPSKIPNK